MCECACVGGVTSLLQTAMLCECNLILHYAPSSIPFRYALYLLLNVGSEHNFASPIFVIEGGPILILLQISVAQLLNMAESCTVPGSTALVAVKPQERHFTLYLHVWASA